MEMLLLYVLLLGLFVIAGIGAICTKYKRYSILTMLITVYVFGYFITENPILIVLCLIHLPLLNIQINSYTKTIKNITLKFNILQFSIFITFGMIIFFLLESIPESYKANIETIQGDVNFYIPVIMVVILAILCGLLGLKKHIHNYLYMKDSGK